MNIYKSVFVMFLFSVIIGYFTMSVIITNRNNITWNLNKFYSALLMGWFMGLVELFMNQEHTDTPSLIIMSIILLSGAIYTIMLIREQEYINSQQYLKSMIEHHEMAISMSHGIMSKPEIPNSVIKLAHGIIKNQNNEINHMKKLLENNFVILDDVNNKNNKKQ